MQLLNYTLGEILEKWAFETPNSEFIVYPDRDLRFTYKQFDERVNQLAKGLLYIGVQPGDKVGIWAKNVPDWTTLFFATAKIGAILVPINSNYKLPELENLLTKAEIHTLFLSEGCCDNDFVKIVAELVPELKDQARGLLQSTKFSKLKNVVFVGQKKYRHMYNTAELLLLGNHIDDIELESVKEAQDCNNVVTIQFAETENGSLQGVMLSHFNILNNGYSVGECMKYSSNERLLICVPLFCGVGNILGVCSIVMHGATLVFSESFDPNMILSAVQKEKCTAINGVPEQFNAVLNYPQFQKFDLNSLRAGIILDSDCSAGFINKVMTKLHIKDVIIVYGSTESSAGITATRTHNSVETHASTIGFELPNVEVKIIDTKTGELCKAEEKGEICCRGYNVMQGYYNNLAATEKVIDSEGWLHTGDFGVKTAKGYYRVTGAILIS